MAPLLRSEDGKDHRKFDLFLDGPVRRDEIRVGPGTKFRFFIRTKILVGKILPPPDVPIRHNYKKIKFNYLQTDFFPNVRPDLLDERNDSCSINRDLLLKP